MEILGNKVDELRTHLSTLASAASINGSSAVLKLPCDHSPQPLWKDITFSQFWKDIDANARYWKHEFSKKGFREQCVIGLWVSGTSYSDILNIWGICSAGYIPQIISGRLTNANVVYELLNKSEAVALIVDPSLEGLLTNDVLPIFRNTDVAVDNSENSQPLSYFGLPANPESTLMIFHTSGSTSGSPKLVPLTAKWIDWAISKLSHFATPLSPKKQQIIVSGGSFCHIASNLVLWSFIDRGGCVVLPTKIPYSSLELIHMVSRCGLNSLNMFSSFLSKIFAEARQDLSLLNMLKRLDNIIHSGLPLDTDDISWARGHGIRLVNVFASTEVGVLLQSDDELDYALKPFPGCEYEFVPLSDNPLSGKVLLELVVPPESPDCPHSAMRNPTTGKFNTGDLFVQVKPGRYLSKGRKDSWIKMENSLRCDVSSIEINAMETCGDIIGTAVVVGAGRPSPVLIVESKDCGEDSMPENRAVTLEKEILRRITPFHERKYPHERINDVSVILHASAGSLPRTAKGSICRGLVERKFKPEIDRLFAARG